MASNTAAAEACIQKAFPKFRPVCVELSRQHSRENVAALSLLLQKEPNAVIQSLLEYILFPLRLILKQSSNRSGELYRDVVSCMKTALSAASLTRWETFQDVFTSLCLSITKSHQNHTAGGISEELKLEVVQCLGIAVHKADVSCLENMYGVGFLPSLGHAVSLLLAFIQHETDRKLRIAATKCILDLACLGRDVTSGIQLSAGRTFASFLPGITLSLSKVITGDTKQGQAVTTTAITAWYKVVILVIGDKSLQDVDNSHKGSGDNDKLQQLVVKRGVAWVEATSEKLGVLIGRVVKVASHSHWRVRLAMVQWADRLLSHCHKSLQRSSGLLLEVLIGGISDDYTEVSTSCHQALERYRGLYDGAGRMSLMAVLGDNLYRLTSQLPRLIRQTGDEEKLTSLNLLLGYLTILEDDVASVLQSYSHLQRLCLALVQVLEFDCSHVSIIQEKNTASTEQDELPSESKLMHPGLRKSFKHFTDHRVLQAVVDGCHKLASYGDINVLVDHLLDVFRQSSVYRKQAIFILTILLSSDSTKYWGQDTSVESLACARDQLITNILDEILSPGFFDLPSSAVQQQQQLDPASSRQHTGSAIISVLPVCNVTSISVEQLNSNIVQTCLILECLAACGKVLGLRMEVHLMEVLYLVLEKVGDESGHVSDTALVTLSHLAHSCQERCVADLLCTNADYLVNSISLRLRTPSRYPHAPSVLSVLIQHSNAQVLPLVEDVIHEVLSTLDHVYHDQCVRFMHVLHALVRAIRHWFPCQLCPPQTCKGREGERTRASPEEVCQYVMDYSKQKKLDRDLVDADDVTDTEGTDDCEDMKGTQTESDSTEDAKKDPPLHIRLVKQVCERCRHLMVMGESRLRVVILDTVAEACQVLQSHKDELLPLVHSLWPPLMMRLSDGHTPVSIKALKTVQVMGQVSGDFVRQRLVKDVFPHLISALKRHTTSGMRTGPSYRHTHTCRWQLAILNNIGPLCLQSGVMEHHLYPVMESCVVYLSSRQPPVLQQAAVSAFRTYTELDEDVVWLLLSDISPPASLNLPHTHLHPVQLGSSSSDEYSVNIQRIWHQDDEHIS